MDSVLAQTFSPSEIIIVDDCSTDETVAIVNSYSDPRVRCIVLEKNSGAQAARNRGIFEAKGEWIAFQDSDDEWEPEKLQKQVEALTALDFDPWTVVHTNAVRFDAASGRRLRTRLPVVKGENVYPFLLSTPGPMFPGMLVSKEALHKIDYLDEMVPAYQEWDTSIRLAKICRFIYLNEPLFVYHLHAGETISKNTRRDISAYQYIVEKFRDEILSVCGEKTWNDHIFFNGLRAIGWGYFQDAERILGKCIGPSPGVSVLKLINKLKIHSPHCGLLVRCANFIRWIGWKISGK